MELDGIKRQRIRQGVVYRNTQLMVAVRVAQAPSIAEHNRAGAKKIDNVLVYHKPKVAQAPVTRHATHVVPPKNNATVPQSVKQAEPKQHNQTSKVTHAKKRSHKLLYATAGLVAIVGGVLAYQAYALNTAVDAQVKKLQTNSTTGGPSSSSNLPSDTKPEDPNFVQNYKVAPQLPQLLTIKKIGVNARVLQVGVNQDNQMEVPKTAYDVAWYNGSSRPGENGAMVIDGHVQGVGGPAVFTNLHKLVAGDTVSVVRGDGKEITYRVVNTETVAIKDVDMGKLLVSVDTAKPGLNLITCSGTYDAKADQFESRTIVYAVQQ